MQFETTTDGKTWATVTSNLPGVPTPSGSPYSISQLSGNGSYWLARLSHGRVYRSTDLASWSLVYTPAAYAGASYVHAGSTLSFIGAVSSSAAPSYLTSTNGTTWTARTAPVYQTKPGGIRAVVTIGSTIYAAMMHGIYPNWQVVWSSSNGVAWTNEYVLPSTSGTVLCGAAVESVPIFGLSRQQTLAKVDGSWQFLATGPDDLLERRQSATKALPRFTEGLTDLPPTNVVGVGAVGKEIVTAQQPSIGMWSSNWPQVALYHDGATLTDTSGSLGTIATIEGGRSNPLPLPADGDDLLYFGNREGLQRLGWELSTAGSYTGLRLEYSTATGWLPLTMTDGTQGLSQDGAMTWKKPKDWARVAVSGQSATIRQLRWVRLRCDGCLVRAVGALEGYWGQEEMLYRGGLYRVGGKELQPWNVSLEIDCLLPLGKRLFAVCYDPDGILQPVVMEVR